MNDLEQPPAACQPFFAPKQFSASFALADASYELEVSTPDLRANPVSVWGDWGPMYTCELDPSQTVTIRYRCPVSGRSAAYEFSPPKIEINSPMLATQRKRWPYVIELVDAARGLRLFAYFDAEARFDHVEVKCVGAGIDPARLLFRGSERPRMPDHRRTQTQQPVAAQV